MKKALMIMSAALGTIAVASAAGAITNGNIVFQKVVSEVLSPLYQLAAGLALAYFFYGAAKFVFDMNDPEKRTFGKSHLFWGLIGLFIIFSVGGILPFINDAVGGMFTY